MSRFEPCRADASSLLERTSTAPAGTWYDVGGVGAVTPGVDVPPPPPEPEPPPEPDPPPPVDPPPPEAVPPVGATTVKAVDADAVPHLFATVTVNLCAPTATVAEAGEVQAAAAPASSVQMVVVAATDVQPTEIAVAVLEAAGPAVIATLGWRLADRESKASTRAARRAPVCASRATTRCRAAEFR